MNTLQDKFQKFLTEDTHSLGQAQGRPSINPTGVLSVDDVVGPGFDIENPDTFQKLNAYLSAAMATPCMNPYFLLMRIQTKLAEVGFSFEIPTLVGDQGSIEKTLLQFGGRYGYSPTSPQDSSGIGFPNITSDDGISQRKPGGVNIKFSWACYKGIYTIDAQLVPGAKPSLTPIKENKPLQEDGEDNVSMKFKTIRNTVDCPYCGTGYTFRSEVKRNKWINTGRKDPLHAACVKSKQENDAADVYKRNEDTNLNSGNSGYEKLKYKVRQKIHCSDCGKFHFEGEACDLGEVSPPGWSGTVKHMKKHKEITNPFALSWWMKNRGDKSHIKPEK